MKKKIDFFIMLILSLYLISTNTLINISNQYYLYVKIAGYVLLILYILIRLFQKDPIKIIKNKLDICVILLVLSTAIPVICNTYVTLSGAVQTILQYINALCIYIILREMTQKNNKYCSFIFNSLIILAVFTVIVGIDGVTTKKISNIFYIENFKNGEHRLISVFGYANTMAVYISSIMFLNINEILKKNQKYIKPIYKSITLIFMIGIILTYSKAIMIILPVTLLGYVISIRNKDEKNQVIQNIILSFIMAIIYIIVFEKFINMEKYLLIWILFIITILINYCINLLLEKITIKKDKRITKKIVKFSIIGALLFFIYIIIGLNVHDKYVVFNSDVEDDYQAKIINNISSNTKYLLEFDIDSMAPRDIENTYTINVIERDSKNQEVNQTNIKFGTYTGKKQIEITTSDSTTEFKIEFKTEYKYKEKKLIVNALSINNKIIPLKYKYLPTKLVEKVKNININYKTLKERVEMIKNALELSTQNILTGMGGKAWKQKYKEVQNYKYTANILHSYPAKVILEFGLLGIIAYLLIAIITIYMLIKFIKDRNIENISITFAFLILCVHSLIDVNMEYLHILIYIFALMGILSTKLESKEKTNIISTISNIVLIFICMLSIYLNVNTKIYTKYSEVTNSIKQRNGLVRDSEEYKEVNRKIAIAYEYMLKYERYNYLENYFTILNYYMDSNVENKLEILQEYYNKILPYKNKKQNDIQSIIAKIQGSYNIINYLEEEKQPQYYEIIQKFIDIIIQEYQDTQEQLQECLENQHSDDIIYTLQLSEIYSKAKQLKTEYLLDVKVLNESDIRIDEEKLKKINIEANEGDILIYHTHTTESYKSRKEEYVTYDFYKSLDENYNVIKVGNYLTELLLEKGINTIHNTEYYNYPSDKNTYAKSRKAVQNILAKNKNIKKIIDIHRDSYISKEIEAETIDINGEKVAPLRFVIGIDSNTENWMYDLKWALEMQKIADQKYPNLFRPILIREREYNQDLSKYAILIEVGENCNYIDDVLKSTKYLSDILSYNQH